MRMIKSVLVAYLSFLAPTAVYLILVDGFFLIELITYYFAAPKLSVKPKRYGALMMLGLFTMMIIGAFMIQWAVETQLTMEIIHNANNTTYVSICKKIQNFPLVSSVCLIAIIEIGKDVVRNLNTIFDANVFADLIHFIKWIGSFKVKLTKATQDDKSEDV